MPPLPERNLNSAPVSLTASGGLLGIEGGALVVVPDALGPMRQALLQARAAQAEAEAAAGAAKTAADMIIALLNGGQVPTPGGAPVVLTNPSFSPSTGLRVGDTATLNFGTAAGTPAPARTYILRRGTVDVTAQVVNGQITFDTAGDYTLSVSWSNGNGLPVQAVAATITVAAATDGPGVAPVVTTQPSFSPATGRRVGDTVTLNFGAASGTPAPMRTFTLRRGTVDVTAQVVNGQITFITAGTYTLEVSWSNGVGAPVQATTASITVAAAPVETPWQTVGGVNEITINAMPSPAQLAPIGGMNEITIGN